MFFYLKMVTYFSIIMILISVTLIILRSIPSISLNEKNRNSTNGSETDVFKRINTFYDSIAFEDFPETPLSLNKLTVLGQTFETIDFICFAWFLFEYLIRLICSPNKKKFIISPTNLIDLISIVPFFFYLILRYNVVLYREGELLRMLRIVILLKVTRHSDSLKIFGKTIQFSYKELMVLLIYLSVAVVFFGSCVFYTESHEKNTEFVSIPASCW